jgi:hypothetical protein
LGRYTLAVVGDEALRSRLASAAVERELDFAEDRFASHLLTALAPVLKSRQPS